MAAIRSAPAFRAAGPADVDAVVALVESAYRGEASREGWTTEADLLDGRRTDADMVAALLERPGSTVLLAEDDGAEDDGAEDDGADGDRAGGGGGLLGCCHLEVGGPVAHFGMFAVRPRDQGRGTGRALLRRAEEEAAAAGAAVLEMEVLRQRPDLIAWYERGGYRRTGATRPFPAHDPRFGLPRRPDLVFEVLERPL